MNGDLQAMTVTSHPTYHPFWVLANSHSFALARWGFIPIFILHFLLFRLHLLQQRVGRLGSLPLPWTVKLHCKCTRRPRRYICSTSPHIDLSSLAFKMEHILLRVRDSVSIFPEVAKILFLYMWRLLNTA